MPLQLQPAAAGNLTGNRQSAHHISKRGSIRKQVERLEDESHVHPKLMDLSSPKLLHLIMAPVKNHFPGIRFLQKACTAEHRRLSRSGRSQDCHNFAPVDLDVLYRFFTSSILLLSLPSVRRRGADHFFLRSLPHQLLLQPPLKPCQNGTENQVDHRCLTVQCEGFKRPCRNLLCRCKEFYDRGGKAMGNACGSTTWIIIWGYVIPTKAAASLCPAGTAWIADLRTSAL